MFDGVSKDATARMQKTKTREKHARDLEPRLSVKEKLAAKKRSEGVSAEKSQMGRSVGSLIGRKRKERRGKR